MNIYKISNTTTGEELYEMDVELMRPEKFLVKMVNLIPALRKDKQKNHVFSIQTIERHTCLFDLEEAHIFYDMLIPDNSPYKDHKRKYLTNPNVQ